MTGQAPESEYEQVYDEEWFDYQKPLYLSCCDCGLVHEVFVRRRGNKIQLMLKRNPRSTAQLRRHHALPCVKT